MNYKEEKITKQVIIQYFACWLYIVSVQWTHHFVSQLHFWLSKPNLPKPQVGCDQKFITIMQLKGNWCITGGLRIATKTNKLWPQKMTNFTRNRTERESSCHLQYISEGIWPRVVVAGASAIETRARNQEFERECETYLTGFW